MKRLAMVLILVALSCSPTRPPDVETVRTDSLAAPVPDDVQTTGGGAP